MWGPFLPLGVKCLHPFGQGQVTECRPNALRTHHLLPLGVKIRRSYSGRPSPLYTIVYDYTI